MTLGGYNNLSLPERLRLDATEWDISECPARALTSMAAADEIERLRCGIAAAVAELDADHWHMNPRSGSPIDDDELVKGRTGCGMCWPHDGGWPCTSRAIADDLRALLTEEAS